MMTENQLKELGWSKELIDSILSMRKKIGARKFSQPATEPRPEKLTGSTDDITIEDCIEGEPPSLIIYE